MEEIGISQAKALAMRYGKDIVVVLHVGAGRLGYASYGRNRQLCELGGRLADVAYEAVERELVAMGQGGDPFLRERKARKAGLNERPTMPPPEEPKGQGGRVIPRERDEPQRRRGTEQG